MISVVIPARDEVGSVARVVSDVHRILQATGRTYEILVVDDGSTDGTAAAAAGAQARVLQLGGLGYGAAIKFAAAQVTGDVIALLDADGTYPVEELPALLACVEGGARQAIGARPSITASEPMARSLIKGLFRLAVRLGTGLVIPDLNSGMRVVRTADVLALAPILPDRFSLTTTLTLALAAEGDTPVFLPIPYHPREGRSKWRAIRDTWLMARTVLRGIGWLRRKRAPRALPALEAVQP